MNKVELVVKQMKDSQDMIDLQCELQAAHYETVLCMSNLQILLEQRLKEGSMEPASLLSGAIQELEKVEQWLLEKIEV